MALGLLPVRLETIGFGIHSCPPVHSNDNFAKPFCTYVLMDFALVGQTLDFMKIENRDLYDSRACEMFNLDFCFPQPTIIVK